MQDEEYLRFKEEETNTKKMSTILKSLVAPFQKTPLFNSSAQRSQSSKNI
jgi:hypothetical protein